MANVVTAKGRGQEFAVERAVMNIRRLGHGPILLKTDGEPALVDLRRAVASALGTQAIPERPVAYEPQSNGSIESGVKQFKGQLRTLLFALEDRIGADIPATHPIITWLVEHATELLATHLVGHDGLTPYQKLFGNNV